MQIAGHHAVRHRQRRGPAHADVLADLLDQRLALVFQRLRQAIRARDQRLLDGTLHEHAELGATGREVGFHVDLDHGPAGIAHGEA